jgi:hypothetical protein
MTGYATTRPRCPICLARHYRYEPHEWSDDLRPRRGAVSAGKAEEPSGDLPREGRADDGGLSDKAKFDRAAYQREYMRRRRAAQVRKSE